MNATFQPRMKAGEPTNQSCPTTDAMLLRPGRNRRRPRLLLQKIVPGKRMARRWTVNIVRLRDELADAQYDLDQTVVRAPTGGFVTELALRPGVYVVPAPFRPTMVFVNDGPTDRAFVAGFQQNSLQVRPKFCSGAYRVAFSRPRSAS